MFSTLDPHLRQVHSEGTETVLATTLTKVSPVPETPVTMRTNTTDPAVERLRQLAPQSNVSPDPIPAHVYSL